MMKTEYQYKINIARPSEVMADGRNLGPFTINIDFDGDPLCGGNDVQISSYGFKVLINLLSLSITNLSQAAADELGINEGEVIRDAINQLETRLVDAGRKKPKLLVSFKEPRITKGNFPSF